MDLLCDAPTIVVLTPDTASEQTFLPEPAALRASLLLADRGYLDLHYLRRVQDEGGFFLIRAKAGMQRPVVEASEDRRLHPRFRPDEKEAALVLYTAQIVQVEIATIRQQQTGAQRGGLGQKGLFTGRIGVKTTIVGHHTASPWWYGVRRRRA